MRQSCDDKPAARIRAPSSRLASSCLDRSDAGMLRVVVRPSTRGRARPYAAAVEAPDASLSSSSSCTAARARGRRRSCTLPSFGTGPGPASADTADRMLACRPASLASSAISSAAGARSRADDPAACRPGRRNRSTTAGSGAVA